MSLLWRRVRVKTPPTSLAGDLLAGLKLAQRLDTDDFDAELTRCLDGAVRRLDGPSGVGIALRPQVWTLSLDQFSIDPVELPGWPVGGVGEVRYIDPADNSSTVLDENAYELTHVGDQAFFQSALGVSFPAAVCRLGAVEIDYTLGHASTTAIPADLIDAIYLLAGHRFRNPEAVAAASMAALPEGVMEITADYRRKVVG